MDERRPYLGFTGSSVLHGVLLALILFGLASAPKFAESPESIPVETISQSQLNQIMNGEKDAKPAPMPPPTPPEAPPNLRAAEEPTPAPKPPPPPPPSKPAAAQDTPVQPPERPKVVETPPERPKEPAFDKPAKSADRDKSEPAPKPPTRSYDPAVIAKIIGQIKPPATSVASTQVGATPQGLPHHDATHMSISMASALDAWLTERYLDCWTPPPSMPDGDTYVAQIKVVFNADGSLSARPVLLNPPTDPAWRAHAESAMRAVKKCDPLHVPAQFAPFFEDWKIQTIHFDPRESQG